MAHAKASRPSRNTRPGDVTLTNGKRSIGVFDKMRAQYDKGKAHRHRVLTGALSVVNKCDDVRTPLVGQTSFPLSRATSPSP